MIPDREIQATCDDIVREFAPLQVILFGSYAYGNPPTEASDVDMFVVMAIASSETARQRDEIRKRIPRRFRLDLHVHCPEDIAYRVAHNDWFLREVFEKGDVLYETEVALPQFRRAEETLVPIWEETGVMNPLTLEWVRIAEADWKGLKMAQQASEPDLNNRICFDAQQCIEKYVKAWLQEANIPVPLTHDLNQLLALIVPSQPKWDAWQIAFSAFEPYAVDARYPGYLTTAAQVEHAIRICSEVRREVRAVLQLPNDA